MKPATTDLLSVNEKVEIEAQKVFYDKVHSEMGKAKAKRLQFWINMTKIYTPTFALMFVAIYWFAGLKHANIF